MNNFKELEKKEIKKVAFAPPQIKENISGNISFIKLVSSVIELYLPRFAELFISMSGGKNANYPPNKQTIQDNSKSDNRNIYPSNPDEI